MKNEQSFDYYASNKALAFFKKLTPAAWRRYINNTTINSGADFLRRYFLLLYSFNFNGKTNKGDIMNDKKQSSFKEDNPYRFDMTAEFLKERYNKISSAKSRIETESEMTDYL